MYFNKMKKEEILELFAKDHPKTFNKLVTKAGIKKGEEEEASIIKSLITITEESGKLMFKKSFLDILYTYQIKSKPRGLNLSEDQKKKQAFFHKNRIMIVINTYFYVNKYITFTDNDYIKGFFYNLFSSIERMKDQENLLDTENPNFEPTIKGIMKTFLNENDYLETQKIIIVDDNLIEKH